MSALRRYFPILAHANLANGITTTNLLLGVVGIHFAVRGAPMLALVCGALAIPCDIMDGVVARRTGTTSRFGAQLDTLADAVSFCLLPAAIAYAFSLPAYTLVAALLYALAGLLRLARFTEVGTVRSEGRERFEGVPTAFAAALCPVVAAIAVWLPESARPLWFTGFYLLLAPAMCSALPFPKRGLHTRLMWVLVPAALTALWLR